MYNQSTSKNSVQLCIHHLFEAQVARSPEASALVFEGEALSYGELNAKANRLAHRLITLGVRPDQHVAICVERSPAMIVGLMAILKAGGAYVPLDPENSRERLAFILADTAPVMVLADTAGRQALGDTLQAHTVFDPCDVPPEADANPEVPDLTPNNLAYIIYTSGSTGQPKGVMVEHAQVVRLFDTTHATFGFNASDVWCLFHSFAFDFSVWELWGALRYGGMLVLVPHAITRSPQAFYQLICKQGITVLNQTPSAFTGLMGYVKPSSNRLRYVIFGGEALQPSTLRDWYGVHDESFPQLVNMYGITETTVHVTYYPLTSSDAQQDDSVIGQPLSDLNLYLLDTHGRPVPMGDVGEIYIGGAGVARGYLNRPDLTAERFLHDAFAGKTDARMYKTGDLARYLPNGNLVFLGRNDDQVKIRGLRIEPGEIVARLTEHPSIREAVVEVQGVDPDKRLVAYVVAHTVLGSDTFISKISSEEGLPLAGRLRDYLSKRLPDYMVPSAFVLMECVPLTPNGKLDRQALTVPEGEAFAHAAYKAPQGEIETILAALWSGLLGIEQIGRHDNFFALGGHSLMAVQLMQKVRSYGLECSLNDIFEHPRLANLASKIAKIAVFQSHGRAVTVRTGGSEPPVFFVPSGLADYSYAISLAQQLRVNCPIHVLPWSAIGDPLPHSIEDMAERMIPLIQAIQPEGPYRIAGYSSGGILAYAIAYELICLGEDVGFLGLIDVPAPQDLLYKNKDIKQYFIEHVKAVVSEDEFHKFDTLNKGDELAVLIRKAQDLGGYDLNADISLETVKWQVIYHFSQIARAYKPLSLTINLSYFYAAEREHSHLPQDDIVGGWRALLPDLAISSVSIPGRHVSLMEDISNRKHLAEAFDRALL